MDSELIEVARALNFKKVARLQAIDRNDQLHLLDYLLKNCIRGTYGIIFFPSKMIQVTPYGIKYGIKFDRTRNENYLTIHPELNEKYLRQVFTSFEVLIYKINHILHEAMRPEYSFEKHSTLQRFKRLKNLISDQGLG